MNGHSGDWVICKAGCGVEQDDEQAVFWYQKAADQGHDRSQKKIADMYKEVRGVKRGSVIIAPTSLG